MTERMRRYRQKKKGVTNEGVTGQGVTSHNTNSASQETVPASYVPGTNGKEYLMLPERPRFLILSDGQVLDRANQPSFTQSEGLSDAMLRANDNVFGYVPNAKPLPASLRRRFK